MNVPISDRLDVVRCLLLILWQSYSALGTNCGRSHHGKILEAAMDILGPPRSEFRRKYEFDYNAIMELASKINIDYSKMEDNMDISDYLSNFEEIMEKIRKEIELESI